MSDKKVIQFRSPQSSEQIAKTKWFNIPESKRIRILENVWCSKCSGATSIALESIEAEQGNLILRGKCKTCGNEVCRVVEGENG